MHTFLNSNFERKVPIWTFHFWRCSLDVLQGKVLSEVTNLFLRWWPKYYIGKIGFQFVNYFVFKIKNKNRNLENVLFSLFQ